jgi:phasin family protein
MTNQNPFAQFTEAFKSFAPVSEFKAPAFDFNKVFSAGKRNAEAFSAAGQVVIQSVQEVSRRSADIARGNVESLINASREAASGKTPELNTARQIEAAKGFYDNGIKNAREISEILTKSSSEAFEIINKRTSENIAELTKAA